MKLIKSLLLGSAAGLVAVAGAQAADLGVKKPSAVEYVKTCPTYGAGFFVVPGSTSCLKILGRVRVDYMFNNDRARTDNKNNFLVRGYVGFDHRTATEYGLLRTYVRAFIQRNNNVGVATTPAVAAATVLEYAFIQFGGLTVGRVTPVFEHGWHSSFQGANGSGGSPAQAGFSDIVYVNSIGYTANFGGGFSATVALDSARERQVALAGAGAVYGGQAMPDVVAKLAYDAAWGSAFVAGAVHQIRDGNIAHVSTKYGYAGAVGVKVNLPFLAKGSNLWASGTIAEGAASYTGHTATTTIGAQALAFSDATRTATGFKLTKTLGIAGGIQAYVTPTVWVALTGTYATHDPFGAVNTTKTASVFGTVGWTPVAGFLIGGELGYLKASGRTAGGAVMVGDKDNFLGRIRFQRDF